MITLVIFFYLWESGGSTVLSFRCILIDYIEGKLYLQTIFNT